MAIDETTDVCGRYIGNVIVGKMSSEMSRGYLICSKPVLAANHSTMINLVNDSLSKLKVYVDLIAHKPPNDKSNNILKTFCFQESFGLKNLRKKFQSCFYSFLLTGFHI